jgi:hypothetical protein
LAVVRWGGEADAETDAVSDLEDRDSLFPTPSTRPTGATRPSRPIRSLATRPTIRGRAEAPAVPISRRINEAFLALESQLATAEEIDRSCVRGLGLPLGPLAAADAFGLDVLLACTATLHHEFGDKYRPAPMLVKLVRAGCLGRKTGRRVYDYSKRSA